MKNEILSMGKAESRRSGYDWYRDRSRLDDLIKEQENKGVSGPAKWEKAAKKKQSQEGVKRGRKP